jgi:alpha-ketoglutarate-dependent taurine dioxygenase
MSHQTLTVEKLTPHIGAEVLGVDLSRPLEEPTFKQVHDALIEKPGDLLPRSAHDPRAAEGLRPPLR